MVNNAVVSILKTIIYADIFEYPLTYKELYKYAISNTAITPQVFEEALRRIASFIFYSDGMYALLNRKKLIAKRKRRKYFSKKKMNKAQYIARIIGLLPSVKLVGISGSLSMNNCKTHDDIDLFIVTSNNTLWMTRCFITCMLFVLKEKRGKRQIIAQDKICLNMFLTEDNLKLSDTNIYSAHEVAQLKVLVNKNNTYEKFLSVNQWVLNFMPHAFLLPARPVIKKSKMLRIMEPIISKIDTFFYMISLKYMQKSITSEVVDKKTARFHPKDKTEIILREFRKRYAQVLQNIIADKAVVAVVK